MRLLFVILLTLLASACASYGGAGLKPGVSTLDDVLRVMGKPAMSWTDSDGSIQLAYPRGPMGFHSFMAYIAPDSKLVRIRSVLQPESFARIRPGMTQQQVLRVLGPPQPAWTGYYPRRDELAWEWRFCNDWHQASRFDVLFDAGSKKVRSAISRLEDCGEVECTC